MQDLKNLINKYEQSKQDKTLKDKASLQAVANNVVSSSLMKGSK